MTRNPVERSPAKLSATLALAAGVIAMMATAVANPLGGVVAAPGLLGVFYGVTRGSRRAVTIGSFLLFVGAIVGPATGTDSPAVLVAVVGSVLAWDIGEHAINVGEQLGREADTTNGEMAHAAASVVIGSGAAALAYLLYVSASGSKPLTSLVLLLFAAIVLTSLLSE